MPPLIEVSDVSFGRNIALAHRPTTVPDSAPTPTPPVESADLRAAPLQSEAPDQLAFIAVAFGSKLPIISLDLSTGVAPPPGRTHNFKQSYSLGIGRSSTLELHHLNPKELEALRRQTGSTSHRVVALKSHVSPVRDWDALRSFKQELRVHACSKLRHHGNIVNPLFIGFTGSHDPVLALELAEFGTLADVFFSRVLEGSDVLAFDLALDTAAGLAALHSVGISHGDLKPRNILVFRHPKRKAVAKIADFGDCLFVQDLVGREWQPLAGTHSWRAPECYDEMAIYDPYKPDIYSLGLCIVSILAPGNSVTDGTYDDSFLDRILHDRRYRRDEVLEHKNLSGTAVIVSAKDWVTRKAVSPLAETLGHMIATTCLNRDPNRRIDAQSVVILVSAKMLGRGGADRWLEEFASLKGQVDELFELSENPLDDISTPVFNELEELDLFNPTDSRFTNLGPSIHRRVFELFVAAASLLNDVELPEVDEDFPTGDFTFRDLTTAFAASTESPDPPLTDKRAFRRACIASRLLIICSTEGWGDTSADISDVAKTWCRHIVTAARHGAAMSTLKYLEIAQHHDLLPPDDSKAAWHGPIRLWLSWAMLNGNQLASKALVRKDPQLHQKVLEMARIRQGPLYKEDDPTAFMERHLTEISESSLDSSTAITRGGNTILHLAIYNGNLALVRKLISEMDHDINQMTFPTISPDVAVDEGNESPAILAARTANIEILHFLLSKGPDASCTSRLGRNVLHSITSLSEDDAVDLAPCLVAGGASLTQQATEYSARGLFNPSTHVRIQGSPLRWAVTVNYPALVRSLVSLHRSLAVSVPDLDAILELAADRYLVDIMDVLLDNFAELHPSNDLPSPEILDGLVGKAVGSPLRFVVVGLHGAQSEDQQIKTIRALLSRGAQPLRLQPNDSQLPWTTTSPDLWNNIVIFGSAAALKLIIDSVHANGRTIGEVLKDPHLFDGTDAIQRSIYSNRQPVFNYLMTLVDEGRLDLDFVDDEGMTALHVAACQTNNTAFLEKLLRRGCDCYAQSKQDITPFLNAVINQNFDGGRLLLDAPQCDRNRLFTEQSRDGCTAFGTLVTMAFTTRRNDITVREIEFMAEVGGGNFIYHVPSNTTVLEMLVRIWPSSRPDYQNFDSWLLGWLLDHMPTELINAPGALGLTALHWAAFNANEDAVAKMLQSPHVNPLVCTVGSDMVPIRMTILDIVCNGCRAKLPRRALDGGGHELYLYQQRVKRLHKLLLEQTDIPLMACADSPDADVWEALWMQALEVMSRRIEEETVARISRAATGEEMHDITVSVSSWPWCIPLDEKDVISASSAIGKFKQLLGLS